ncbi:MAG: FAD:protein FMN transferase [Ruminiclostridium sp.]
MKRKYLSAALLAAALCLSSLTACADDQPYTKSAFTFDTFITFTIYESESADSPEEICEGAVDMLNSLDEELSRTNPDSVISALNKQAYNSPVALSETTYLLIKNCKDLSEITDGAFDFTLGEISSLWGFGSDNVEKPDDAELAELAGRKNYENISFDDENRTISFTKEGFSIDLGAAAKGYALDMLDSYLRKAGVTSAVVDFGGSIMTIGKKNGYSWNISVTADESDTPVGTLTVNEGFISTSNGAKRFVEYDGVKYHHIIDPYTAYPADSKIKSCTVYAANGLISDALSTAFFVMGQEKTEQFYEKYKIAEYIITLDDGTVKTSAGIAADFRVSQNG